MVFKTRVWGGRRAAAWLAGMAWWAGLACLAVMPVLAQATTVRLSTVLGPVDIELFDSAAPVTVANFLGYVNRKAYDGSFVHRSVPGFVIQGGGFAWSTTTNSPKSVVTAPAIVNEFAADRSNLRGTVAMARLGKQPNSATSQWFVNLGNNAFLDGVDGGFTVFGRVTGPGMKVVDAIAGLVVQPRGGVFGELPVIGNPSPRADLMRADLVIVETATVLSPATDADRVFNFVEAVYPQYAKPANAVSATGAGYYFRYYAATNAYLGVADGKLYYLLPAVSPEVQLLGQVADWLAQATAAGY